MLLCGRGAGAGMCLRVVVVWGATNGGEQTFIAYHHHRHDGSRRQLADSVRPHLGIFFQFYSNIFPRWSPSSGITIHFFYRSSMKRGSSFIGFCVSLFEEMARLRHLYQAKREHDSSHSLGATLTRGQ